MSLSSIRSFFQKGNRATWCVFGLFTLMLFVKCLLFHWDAFHSILISSLWRDPLSFYKFYMAKLLMPLFIASFIFITKRYWWTIVASFLVDLWCIANLIYYKTYDDFLTVNDILLVGNMDGAWSAVTAYIDWIMVVLILLTALWSAVIILLRHCRNERHWRVFITSFLVVYALAFLNNYFIYNPKYWDADYNNYQEQIKREKEEKEAEEWILFINAHGGSESMPTSEQTETGKGITNLPLYNVIEPNRQETMMPELDRKHYIQTQSILSSFIAVQIVYFESRNIYGEVEVFPEDDIHKTLPFINTNSVECTPNSSLILILVESLESWPLEHHIENQPIAPNLSLLIQQNNVLYCDKICSQTLGGNSGDGQMIINTGLLPTKDNVACVSYGNILYPNFAGFYEQTVMVNPWPKIWNQDTMSVRYGYYTKVEPKGVQWEDVNVIDSTLVYLQNSSKPTCLMAITISTHVPFSTIGVNRITTSAPSLLNRYMQCLNYTDSCIGAFMDAVLRDSVVSQSTIVITGDHTIFKPAMLTEFKDYATAQNLSIASGDNFCPLIIYSPSIEGNIQVTDTCYQMDIYPTIMHLIGCEDYYWKGFGVNLLDSTARHNRPITEQEAYRLSDLMIRSDYFRQYMGKE